MKRLLPLQIQMAAAFLLGLIVAFGIYNHPTQATPPTNQNCECELVRRYSDNVAVCAFDAESGCPNPCLADPDNTCTQWICDRIGSQYYTVPYACSPAATPTPRPTKTPTPTPLPPTLTLEFLCDVWGNAGWCRSGGRIKATGTDPSGQSILVSGDTGGPSPQRLACSGTDTCTATASVVEGTGTAQARATGPGGTVSQALDWKYDPTAPTLAYTILPASPDGLSGWYVTAPQVSVAGSDATSGVASEEVSTDGSGAWSASPITLNDGTHTLAFRVADVAGNVTTQSGPSVKVDTRPPALNPAVSPASPDGLSGWYVTAPEIRVNAVDATSGVAAEEVSLDGGSTWTSNPFTVPDGVHDVWVRARDVAGNTALQSLGTLRVDTTAPSLTVNDPGVLSCLSSLTGRAQDATSGIAQVAWSRDGGATWETVASTAGDFSVTWDVRSLPEGAYVARFRARDVAGNTTEVTREVLVRHPNIGIGIQPQKGFFWDTFRIGVEPRCMKITRMRVVVENPDGPNAVLGEWDTRSWDRYGVVVKWDGMFPNGAARLGTYWLRVDVWDQSGRVLRDFARVVIPVFGPQNTPTPTPSSTPTVTPTTTPTATPENVLPTPPAPTAAAMPAAPTPTPLPPPTPKPADTYAALSGDPIRTQAGPPLALIAAVALAMAVLGMRDPRVPEVARLRRLLRQAQKWQKQHPWMQEDHL